MLLENLEKTVAKWKKVAVIYCLYSKTLYSDVVIET